MNAVEVFARLRSLFPHHVSNDDAPAHTREIGLSGDRRAVVALLRVIADRIEEDTP